MVKKYSKKTFKRKNKISRPKSSKRKHSRNKKKKTKKKKHKNYLKARMKPVSRFSSEAKAKRNATRLDKKGYNKHGEGDYITSDVILHNELNEIRDEIVSLKIDGAPVFILIVSNHGTMQGLLPLDKSDITRPPGRHGRHRCCRTTLPPNVSLVFNIMAGYYSAGWPNSEKRNFIKEDLILHSLSKYINSIEDLDKLFSDDGCLTESGDNLNEELTKLNHNDYCETDGLENQIPDYVRAANLITERMGHDGDIKNLYGVFNKLQVYKENEEYDNQSFLSYRDIDKKVLGIVFKFITSDGYKHLYYNLQAGGLNFNNPLGNELDGVKLSGILEHIRPFLEVLSDEKFITTYSACRVSPTDMQIIESRNPRDSNSVDCYVKKFNESDGETIRGKLEELGFENMIFFYESLMDADRLDTFVTLKSDSEIVSFFQTLGDLSISLPVSEPEPESMPEPESIPEPKQKPQKPSSKPPQKPPQKPPSKPKPQKPSSKPPSKPKPQKPSSKPPSKPKPLPSEEDPFFIGVPPDLPD